MEELKSLFQIAAHAAPPLFQNGLNALHLAAKEGHMDLVQELLDRGAPVDSATKVFFSLSLSDFDLQENHEPETPGGSQWEQQWKVIQRSKYGGRC